MAVTSQAAVLLPTIRSPHDLRTLSQGRTVIMISHRFSTVRNADRILVLDEGRLVEDGDHDTLMARGGLYAELFTVQAAPYAE